YYQDYQYEHIKIGVRVLSNLKKSFHRLNLLKLISKDGFRGSGGRVQTPFEVITGNDLKSDSVKYRIYIAKGDDAQLYESLKSTLFSNERHYNISLGIAGFSAFISNVQTTNALERKVINEWVTMHSACNSEQVGEIDFDENALFNFNHIEEELLPADFIGGEKGREIRGMNRVLFATIDQPFKAVINGTYCQLQNGDTNEENIQFLEYVGVFA
ncbi:MAG: hypothetical protein KDC92_10085, partial [Bacteroidetes bacterium]|nr:hypothetical protein [Bacteroidota bacterium]